MLHRITEAARPSRRQFLKTGAIAGAGLVIGLRLPLRAAKAVSS